jgi:hypothetical protein
MLQVNGTEARPVVFAPTRGQRWGGIELPAATRANAQYAFFTGSGEDDNWFSNNPGVGGSSHQGEQVLFLVAGSSGYELRRTAPSLELFLHRQLVDHEREDQHGSISRELLNSAPSLAANSTVAR